MEELSDRIKPYRGRIPACGIFCGTCPVYTREKRACKGAGQSGRCEGCKTFHLCCAERNITHCHQCDIFPCGRFRSFSKRWLKYGQDMIGNQQLLADIGEEQFLERYNRTVYPEFYLRTATDADLYLLHRAFEASVSKTCSQDYTEKQVKAWTDKATPGRWKELFESDLHFILAESAETKEIAGFTSVSPGGYLHSMFVCPGYQHRGVASLLLYAAEQFAAEHAAGSVHSEVSITARSFFEKRGYVAEKEQVVVIGEIEMINFVMRKSL